MARCMYCGAELGPHYLLDRRDPCETCKAKLSRLLAAMPDLSTTCGQIAHGGQGWCLKLAGHEVEDDQGRADADHVVNLPSGGIRWTLSVHDPEREEKMAATRALSVAELEALASLESDAPGGGWGDTARAREVLLERARGEGTRHDPKRDFEEVVVLGPPAFEPDRELARAVVDSTSEIARAVGPVEPSYNKLDEIGGPGFAPFDMGERVEGWVRELLERESGPTIDDGLERVLAALQACRFLVDVVADAGKMEDLAPALELARKALGCEPRRG